MKNKIYEINSFAQYDLLIKKFGAGYFQPRVSDCLDHFPRTVFIYSKENVKTGCSFTSADRSEIEKEIQSGKGDYANCEIVSFDRAMSDRFDIKVGDQFKVLKNKPWGAQVKAGEIIEVISLCKDSNDFRAKNISDGEKFFYCFDVRQLERVSKAAEKEFSFEEQLKAAKALIGQRIKSTSGNGTGVVKSVKVTDEPMGGVDAVGRGFEILKKQSFVLYLMGEWSNGAKMTCGFHPELYPAEIVKSVKVNGYESVDKGDHYEFGCAKISKELLISAKNLIEQSGKDKKGNRKIPAITIGAGVFTLDTLNQLV